MSVVVIYLQACQVETDASAVGSYVIFLSQHTHKLQMQEMDELAAVSLSSSSHSSLPH